MPEGVSYCHWCGTGVVTPTLEDTALPCPCGDGRLSLRVLPARADSDGDALALAECAACHGVWVSREMIDRLVSSHADDTMLLALAPGLAATRAARATSTDRRDVRYRPCPECAKLMNRVNYARISGIIVDVCKSHGTWFDAHELPALLEFVRRGGLDAARAREVEALATERRRLERERTMRASMDQFRRDPEIMFGAARPRERESVFSLLRELLRRE